MAGYRLNAQPRGSQTRNGVTNVSITGVYTDDSCDLPDVALGG